MTAVLPLALSDAPPLLRGRVMVVTGATAGLGQAAVAAFAAMGASVHGIDGAGRPSGALDAFYRADLGDPDAVAALAAALPDRIDGFAHLATPPADAAPAAVLAAGLIGPRLLADALADRMPDGGAAVLRAAGPGAGWDRSMPAIRAAVTLDHADAAGFALRWNLAGEAGLARRLAQWGLCAWMLRHRSAWSARGLRLNTLDPGEAAPGQPAPPPPDAVAAAAAFLMSDLGRAVQGVCLAADGGALARYQSTLHGL